MLFSLLWACTTPTPTEDSDTPNPTPTGDTGVAEVFDCATVPTTAEIVPPLEAPRGYNDMVFDDSGGMIGHNGSSLVRATSATDAELLVPNVNTVYKMVRLPDGRIFSARASTASTPMWGSSSCGSTRRRTNRATWRSAAMGARCTSARSRAAVCTRCGWTRTSRRSAIPSAWRRFLKAGTTPSRWMRAETSTWARSTARASTG